MRFLTALLSASLPLLANGQAQLLPAGEFSARDGRPGAGKTWRVTDAQGLTLAQAMNAVIAATPIVIDYEHQTLHKERNGQPAPAAGWIKSVTWLTGKGLVSDVEWTDKARAAIHSGEYRYVSPVITWDADSGAVTGVHLAALTNFPALLGMDAAVAALSSLTLPNDSQEPPMKLLLAALATLLGQSALATADEATAVAALQAWKPARGPLPEALTTALGLQSGADEVAALSAVNALKTPSTATVQLVTTLQQQLATLTAQVNGDAVTRAVDAAIDAGKMGPALRDQYVALGQKDMAMLTSILAAMPVIPGLAGQGAAAKAGAAGADKREPFTALTTDQAAIATQLGIPHADYLKTLQAQAA
jgi:phage I-like protein